VWCHTPRPSPATPRTHASGQADRDRAHAAARMAAGDLASLRDQLVQVGGAGSASPGRARGGGGSAFGLANRLFSGWHAQESSSAAESGSSARELALRLAAAEREAAARQVGRSGQALGAVRRVGAWARWFGPLAEVCRAEEARAAQEPPHVRKLPAPASPPSALGGARERIWAGGRGRGGGGGGARP
jgi:hypothetical protein